MNPIRWGWVIISGLLAGVVINACEYLLNGVLLSKSWSDAMRALNRSASFTTPELLSFNAWGFLIGIAAIWLYVSIRAQYGTGWKSAVAAGLAIWAIAYVFNAIPSAAMHLFPRRLIAYGTLVGVVESVGGTIVGAWLYGRWDIRPAERARSAAA